MAKQYHILNGDALKEQFPATINGNLIIARECLVDGNVKAATLDELFSVRAQYLSQAYGEPKEAYYNKAATEFLKLKTIEDEAQINLWFEDDLFCQVNLWFVIYLLQHFGKSNPVYLIRPKKHTSYGFGGLDKSQLVNIFNNRIQLQDIALLSQLWPNYQRGDIDKLRETAIALNTLYPFIITAVQAHIDRIPTEDKLGRPTLSLINIINEIGEKEFGPIFREFCNRESIYGYGDLQVKKLYDTIISKGLNNTKS